MEKTIPGDKNIHRNDIEMKIHGNDLEMKIYGHNSHQDVNTWR